MQGACLYNQLMESRARVPACTHRYMFQIGALEKLVRGPELLKPCVEIHGGVAYLVHHLGDITAIPGENPSHTATDLDVTLIQEPAHCPMTLPVAALSVCLSCQSAFTLWQVGVDMLMPKTLRSWLQARGASRSSRR
jgi:hypothetical protein